MAKLPHTEADLQGATVALLEARAADQVAALMRRHGAMTLSAPALAEIPVIAPEAVQALLEETRRQPPKLAIFQTGTGTRVLFDMAREHGAALALGAVFDRCLVAVRGPKPAAALRSHGIRIDRSAQAPYTTVELLAAVADIAMANEIVLVQRYGETNDALRVGLENAGAAVREIPVYRWALPADLAPLMVLMDELEAGRVDAVVFTSASQLRNLRTVATDAGRFDAVWAALRANRLVSIGPVCSQALRDLGLPVHAEASPPKLGFLVAAVRAALDSSADRG